METVIPKMNANAVFKIRNNERLSLIFILLWRFTTGNGHFFLNLVQCCFLIGVLVNRDSQ